VIETHSMISDEKLIERARRGNSGAFEELVRRHSSRVYGMSFKVLRNREDAEDNLQNAFCKAYGKIQQFEGKSQFSTWLMRIAINEALMMLRKRRSEGFVRVSADWETDDRETTRDFTDLHADPERQCVTRELAARALDTLQPALKNTFMLQIGEGWTNRELATALEVTKDTVKSRMFRARTAMRQHLQELSKREPIGLPS
jgi:RNA polymerase sigma-70 factor (ECF subfamily)